jgi:hypothetical protein
MGIHQPQAEWFSYQVNLDKRVRADHPLRGVAQAVDFSFVRAEVAPCYGDNGNESVDPVILLKMMFLLFYDNVASERELMSIIPERLDYLWFLGYGLDERFLTTACCQTRRRWGRKCLSDCSSARWSNASAPAVSGDARRCQPDWANAARIRWSEFAGADCVMPPLTKRRKRSSTIRPIGPVSKR